MGRIKSKQIKRTALNLKDSKDLTFTESFDNNQDLLKGTMPSKKIRNKVAGYLTRLTRRKYIHTARSAEY